MPKTKKVFVAKAGNGESCVEVEVSGVKGSGNKYTGFWLDNDGKRTGKKPFFKDFLFYRSVQARFVFRPKSRDDTKAITLIIARDVAKQYNFVEDLGEDSSEDEDGDDSDEEGEGDEVDDSDENETKANWTKSVEGDSDRRSDLGNAKKRRLIPDKDNDRMGDSGHIKGQEKAVGPRVLESSSHEIGDWANDDVKTGSQAVSILTQKLTDSKPSAPVPPSKGFAFDKHRTSVSPGLNETPEIRAVYEEFDFDKNFSSQVLSMLEYLIWQCNRTIILSHARATSSYQHQTDFVQMKINELFHHTNFNAYAREFVLFRLFDKKVLSGKDVKGDLVNKLKLAVTNMSPHRHRDLLNHAWESAITSFVKKIPNEKLTPNFAITSGVTLNRNLFTSTPNMQLYADPSGESTFFDLLEKHAASLDAEAFLLKGGATWIIWPRSMTNTTLNDFQLYSVGEDGYVTDKKSIFYGLRRPTTRKEMISVYYFFIVASIARLTEKTLPVEETGLVFSCSKAVTFIRNGTVGDTGNPFMLADLFSSIFKNKTGVEAAVLTSYLFGAFGAKYTNRVNFSYLRAASLITKIIHQCVAKYISADRNLRAMGLSIAEMILKRDQSLGKESLLPEDEENMQYEDFDWNS